MLAKRRLRFWGWLSGVALVRAGRAAQAAGNSHEVAHCVAALRAGDSDHEHDHCRLLTVRRKYIWEFGHGDFRAYDTTGLRIVRAEPSIGAKNDRPHGQNGEPDA